jgi:hypothetical protein
MQFQSFKKALPTKRLVDKKEFKGYVTDLINSSLCPSPVPQAFLVEQAPNWTLPTHFHLQEQFQLIVSGHGSIGKHSLNKLAIHYASEYSGYGPVKSNEKGLTYFTIRDLPDTGAWYLPESYDTIKKNIAKVQLHGQNLTPTSPEELLSLQEEQLNVSIAPTASGIAAWVFKAPANWQGRINHLPKPKGTRFYIITEGNLIKDNEILSKNSVLQTNAAEEIEIMCSDSGAELVILQFKNK